MNKYVNTKNNKGKRFEEDSVRKKRIEFMPIKDFIETFELDYTPESIGYHMKVGKIDWMKPNRDRFVLLTKITKTFYGIS